MTNKQLPIDDTHILNEIKAIVNSGNKAEIEYGRDGVKIIEVQRKVVYPYPTQRKRNPALDVVTSKI